MKRPSPIRCHGWPLAVVLMASLAIAGCGKQAPLIPVEGELRSGRKPLANVLVTFVSTGKPSAKASGVTDPNGRFQLRCDDLRSGALPGEYQVILEDLAFSMRRVFPMERLRRALANGFPHVTVTCSNRLCGLR